MVVTVVSSVLSIGVLVGSVLALLTDPLGLQLIHIKFKRLSSDVVTDPQYFHDVSIGRTCSLSLFK